MSLNGTAAVTSTLKVFHLGASWGQVDLLSPTEEQQSVAIHIFSSVRRFFYLVMNMYLYALLMNILLELGGGVTLQLSN